MYILKSIAFFNKLNLWILILLYIPFKGTGQSLQTHSKGLKDVYQSYFTMGVAASVLSLQGEEAQLIKKEFASITPENAMKMGPIHPEENRYYWKDADSIVSFAQRNGLKVRGHTLCWHEQTPAWLFKDSKGNRVSKEVLLSRLRSHIFTVMQRYKGKVYAWDVVNEAIDDHPDTYLRNSLWYQICGEDFITKAFEYAHEADPDALLFYNDYNTERPEKVERICRLIKSLKDKNVPIYGIGLQAHWSIFEPSTAELENAIRKYAALGLKIQITELDISVYPWEKEKRALRPGESDAYTPALEKQQINKYKEVFQVLRAHRKEITGITFWNISDRHSWLDEYPVQGRKNYPLLFDQQLKRKKAYFAITKF
ncbi:endo-1,4-beta-xylanase [Pedobacter sp.]|jgi:endo-1,4-beta-xylanase|uniref:endo-1,4-beta-xylanase n=1 Tax=Pedobacter sp. TaxID=1411316 RepID=UPI002CFBFDE3|nr:endo-1,4-beta-xylanase [Pedobacter sp.]HWW39950.1 endo-1,4-beta-xylanase [Pedobacter sp.]